MMSQISEFDYTGSLSKNITMKYLQADFRMTENEYTLLRKQ